MLQTFVRFNKDSCSKGMIIATNLNYLKECSLSRSCYVRSNISYLCVTSALLRISVPGDYICLVNK